MFRRSVCRVVIGKDRTFCRLPRKTHMARVGTASPLRRDRGVESSFLQRRVRSEPRSGRSQAAKLGVPRGLSLIRPSGFDWCRKNRVDWVFGLAPNAAVCRHVAALEKSTATRFKAAPTRSPDIHPMGDIRCGLSQLRRHGAS